MDLRLLQEKMQRYAVSRYLANRILLSLYRGYSFLRKRRKWFYMAYQKNWILDPAQHKRQKYWKKCGAHINGNVSIGYDVYFDATNANLITIDEGAWITSRCLLLCHKRKLKEYVIGSNINEFPYVFGPIHICKNAHIGMGTIIMPGVTIGEGAIIGAGAIVTKNIPPYSLAIGQPAKVIKQYPKLLVDEKDKINILS